MKKCSICGKPALEVVEVCPECLQRAAVDPRQIKRFAVLRHSLIPPSMRLKSPNTPFPHKRHIYYCLLPYNVPYRLFPCRLHRNTNIKECMESILEIAEDLERSGSIGKEEQEEKGASILDVNMGMP